MKLNQTNVNGLVLLAKQSGPTSFASLHSVKKALNTSKVGHTGTLDSFAQGLLVVCVGRLTRLASFITSFNKSYKAIIEFGKETDSLDPLGNVIKTSTLPTLQNVINSLNKFTGVIEQTPPTFSALKVNGNRASDIIRSGKNLNLASRKIEVFSSKILEVMFSDGTKVAIKSDNTDGTKIAMQGEASNVTCSIEGTKVAGREEVPKIALDDQAPELLQKQVKYINIEFDVSKGTYIRSLARDIAINANSCAHLIGLLRTKVGSFTLENACGYDLLEEFNIDNAILNLDKLLNYNVEKSNIFQEKLTTQILQNIKSVSKEVATLCGFELIEIKDEFIEFFSNGRNLQKKFFNIESEKFTNLINKKIAVFTQNQKFIGIIEYKENKLIYDFVIC